VFVDFYASLRRCEDACGCGHMQKAGVGLAHNRFTAEQCLFVWRCGVTDQLYLSCL
jgi:hypothetical protein